MPTKSTVLAVVVLAVLIGACETSKPERATPVNAPSDSSALSKSDESRLLERVESARDREFDTPPQLKAVANADELPDVPPSPAAVRDERALLLEQLFGIDPDTELLAKPQRPFGSLARYDADNHRVVYTSSHPDKELVEVAIIAALVEALDAQHFDALPASSTWDGELAVDAARYATVSVAVASDLLTRHPKDVSMEHLASRPELLSRLPILRQRLQGEHAEEDEQTRLASQLQTFVLAEGWSLAAALHRSSGWSGVELARLNPPTQSADVVRPDLWMKGEPVGNWKWPSETAGGASEGGSKPAASSTVGPALVAIWLESVVGAQLARTLYAGYLSDAYRWFPNSEQSPARLEWLSLWNSPDSAQQVARGFEMRLRKRFAHVDQPRSRFIVFQKGLKVGVILSELPHDELRQRARKLLDAHSVRLAPREGLLTSFVASRQDKLVEQLQSATIDERVWTSPASNLRLDLSELGQRWDVQQPDRGAVRWFARHEDDSLLQLTIELEDPLGPEFASEAYREQLVEAFTTSMQDAELQRLADFDTLPERGLTARIAGIIDEQPRTLQLWQFQSGDLVITYSLQAPPEHFDEHRSVAVSILEDAETVEENPRVEPRDEASGTIEYKVEE